MKNYTWDVRSPKNKTPFRCIFQLDKECYKKKQKQKQKQKPKFKI